MSDILQEDQTKQMVDAALRGPFPKTYMNGFNLGLGASDLFLVTKLVDMPTNVIFMSLPIAKTLMLALKKTIEGIEQKMGESLLTMDEMSKITQNLELSDKP